MPENGMLGRLPLSKVQGPMNDLQMKLAERDGETWLSDLKKFLRGEPVTYGSERTWREQAGIIYFSVTSNGATGEEWIKRLESNSFRVSDYAKSVLRSSDFKPTDGVMTKIVVLKGMLFSDDDRITEKIRAEADKRKLIKPNAEVACLIREKFTDEELESMGLQWFVAMHEPINDSDGDPRLLGVDQYDDGRCLNAYYADFRWSRGDGFAFVASQV